PGNSAVEDNINIHLSGGTAASPLSIHDNYIQGGYTVQPWNSSYGYSGGGILLGDGSPAAAARDGVGVSAYVSAFNNQVVSTTNYGIAIAAGHDIQFYNNRIVSSGLLPDGRVIAEQNVGAYIWDSYGAGSSYFYNNSGHDNLIGWVKADGSRNDWWVPNASSWTNNVHWPGSITLATEAAEFTDWQNKLAAAGVVIGPTTTATPTSPIITTQPANQSVTAGQSATFTAAASGNPTPTVQWEVSTDGGTTWNAIGGATSTTL